MVSCPKEDSANSTTGYKLISVARTRFFLSDITVMNSDRNIYVAEKQIIKSKINGTNKTTMLAWRGFIRVMTISSNTVEIASVIASVVRVLVI